MKGLQVIAEQQQDLQPGEAHWSIGYRFDQLVEPVLEFVSDCYWLINSRTIFLDSPDDTHAPEPTISKVIIEQTSHYILAEPRFITEFSNLFIPDWTNFFGVPERIDLHTVQITPAFLESTFLIFFRCVDAAFWEVYSPKDEILQWIAGAFPKSILCQFEPSDVW